MPWQKSQQRPHGQICPRQRPYASDAWCRLERASWSDLLTLHTGVCQACLQFCLISTSQWMILKACSTSQAKFFKRGSRQHLTVDTDQQRLVEFVKMIWSVSLCMSPWCKCCAKPTMHVTTFSIDQQPCRWCFVIRLPTCQWGATRRVSCTCVPALIPTSALHHFCCCYLKANKVSKSEWTKESWIGASFLKCANALGQKVSKSVRACRNISLPNLACFYWDTAYCSSKFIVKIKLLNMFQLWHRAN